MRVEYPLRYLRTWRQLAIQSAVSSLILQPPLLWRLSSERLVVSIALGGLALAAVSLSLYGLRFMDKQEAQHPYPTAEMRFVFNLVAVYPLAMTVFLLILLSEM